MNGGGGTSRGEAGPSSVPVVTNTPNDMTPAEPAPPPPSDITFSVPSGTFEDPVSVSLETTLPDAVIRYTTDGSAPGADSPVYSGEPLQLSETTQIRAQAFEDGVAVGVGATGLYIARTFDMTSDLPLIVVESYGGGKPEDRDEYADMAFMVFEPAGGAAALSAAPKIATRGGYHLRGQSSATFEQAPYRIELWNHLSEDADHALLGMPADSDWALIGPFVDRSLIRNAFAYGLGRDMGLAAPRFAFAEVYINYEGGPLQPEHYEGIYMLVETIKNSSNRLDLAQLEETDTSPAQLSGGYIFKFDWAAAEEPTLECSGAAPISGGFGGGFGPGQGAGGTCWADLEVVDPEPLAAAQAAWLTDHVQQFHDALHETSFAEYSQLMELASFVDVFIVNELLRNADANIRSAYYFKERNEPLAAGPLWDFNLTLGLGFGSSLEVEGWQFPERRGSNDWYQILGDSPEFLAAVSLRWRALRQTLLSEAELERRIDTLITPLANAAVRDFERWPVSVTSQSMFQGPNEPTWEGQLEVLREWLGERLTWMDSQL